MGSRQWLAGVMLGLVLALVGSGTVLAQSGGTVHGSGNSREQECRINRNSERCICWNVNIANTEWVMAEPVVYKGRPLAYIGTPLRSLYLKGYTDGLVYLPAQFDDGQDQFEGLDGNPPVVRSGILGEFNPSYLKFEFGVEVPPPSSGGWKVKQDLLYNADYRRDCAFTYLEEDLRRLWQIAGLLVGALLSITVAWAGVVHMQETASGNSYARTRTILVRALVGAIIVGGCYFIVDAINVELFGIADFWWTQEGALFDGWIQASP